MIKILKALKKDVKNWSKEEWHKVDIAHYGRPVEWDERKFRFKAVEDGKLVGLITGRHEAGVIYIATLITAGEARGKGIGTKLVQKAEEYGKRLNAHKMWLITGKDWSENAFYQKLGFNLVATLPDFHFHKDFVIYTRPIK